MSQGATGSTQYYIRVRGKVHGPFDVEKLKKLHARGQFSRAHEVSVDKRSWQAAAELPELFPPSETVQDSRENVYVPVDPSDEFEQIQSAPPESSKWYYSIGEERHGPVSMMDLRQLVLTGQLTMHDLVWKEGMADWVPLAIQPELQLLRVGGPAAHAADGAATGMASLPRMSGLAIASLTLGILGLVLSFCTIGVCSIMAIVFGAIAMKDIGRSRGLVTGRGMAISGLVMGIIGTTGWLALWILWWLSIITLPHQ
jgi:hypothetical protein